MAKPKKILSIIASPNNPSLSSAKQTLKLLNYWEKNILTVNLL